MTSVKTTGTVDLYSEVLYCHNVCPLSSSLKGTIGFEAQIDKCLELSEYLYNKIKDREGYEMVFDGKVSLIECV